jgi:hypothetical protein
LKLLMLTNGAAPMSPDQVSKMLDVDIYVDTVSCRSVCVFNSCKTFQMGFLTIML